MELEINSDGLDKLLSDKEIVVIDFWAPWCGPCKTLGPIVEDVAESNTDENVAITKVNVDNDSALARTYGVRSIPTIVFIKEGVVVDRTVGVKSKDEIEEIIKGLK
jgi:thioredoxin 1